VRRWRNDAVTTARKLTSRVLAVLVAALLVGSCAGGAEEATPTSWGDGLTVAQIAAVLTDPAAATDCELDPSGYVDMACGFRATEAAEALGAKGDPAAVPALMAAIQDPETYHDATEASWEALEEIGGPEVVAGLVELITSGSPSLVTQTDPADDPQTRGQMILIADRAADMLGRLGGVEHNQLLVEAGVAYEGCSGSGYSGALVMINKADATPLLKYLESSDTDWVYGPLIRIGQPGTEEALMAPLAEGRATTPMAECLLNSGNPTLERAAEEWAAARGLTISRLPGFSTTWDSG
jgi:HEAT repeat protein